MDGVLPAAIDRRMALLFPVSANLGHGHAAGAEFLEGCRDGVHLIGPDDGLEQNHDAFVPSDHVVVAGTRCGRARGVVSMKSTR